jgi:glycerophosphoryl diester phosphodiesterase
VSKRPILFAHRGGARLLRENTIGAFQKALAHGATGLETDVRLTRDGQVVLHHDADVRRFGVMRTSLSELDRADLPGRVGTLGDLYETCGADFELSIDLKDPETFPGVIAAAREAGGESAVDRLWLCSKDEKELRAWHEAEPTIRLCRSADRPFFSVDDASVRLATLREMGVRVVNLRSRIWNAELVAATQAAGLKAFAWDVNRANRLKRVLGFGVDGIYADRVPWMVKLATAAK